MPAAPLPALRNGPEPILLIRMSSLGDVVLSTAVLHALWQQHPEWPVHFLVRPEYADFVRHHPAVQKLWLFSPRAGLSGLWFLRRAIRRQGYRAIVDLHVNLRTLFLTLGPGGPPVHRFQKHLLKRFLLVHGKINLYHQKSRPVPSVPERYLLAARGLGLSSQPPVLDVRLPDHLLAESRQKWQRWLAEGYRILIAPGARHFTKRWPPEFYARLLTLLYRRHRVRAILVGSPEEQPLCQWIARQATEGAPRVMAGTLSLTQTAALVAGCPLFVSNDSGLMHIAAAFQRPQLAIFGSTTRELGFFPRNPKAIVLENPEIRCRPCSHIGRARCPKGHFLCMRTLTPEMALHHLEQLLPLTE